MTRIGDRIGRKSMLVLTLVILGVATFLIGLLPTYSMIGPVRPKGDKREWTCAALIRAAAEIIGEKGWDRTSLEEVAWRSGMTRAAIYGNFNNLKIIRSWLN